MVFCEAPPLILSLHGDLAITTRSIPSVIAIPIYLAVCFFLCVRRRTFGWYDPFIVVALVGIQLSIQRTGVVSNEASGLPGYALLMPFMFFLAGYASWRVAGGKPLANWPWPRFGLVATLTLLLTDIGMAMQTPAAEGKVWQIGGACMQDALLIGPPFVMLIFYGLLDCKSSWVFCSQKCVRIGRCRFGMDGKVAQCSGRCSSPDPFN